MTQPPTENPADFPNGLDFNDDFYNQETPVESTDIGVKKIQAQRIENTGLTLYTVNFPEEFTTTPVLTLSTERNDTNAIYIPQLTFVSKVFFKYRLVGITLSSGSGSGGIGSGVATDAHTLNYTAIVMD